MKKSWLIIIAVLAVVGIGGAFLLLSNLNSIVARIIEDQGSEVTATRVEVAGVDISLRDGRGTINGLSIASPDGFKTSHAFTLGEITLDIDLASVREEPIVIEEIRVQAPVINAEFLKAGASNIDQLRKNTEQYSEAHSGGGEQNSDDLKRIRIKKFVFEKGHIEVDLTELGLENRSLDLPAITLDDIGGPEGALPDEIARAVLGALTKKATAEIAKAEIGQKVQDKAKEVLTDKAQGLLDKFGK